MLEQLKLEIARAGSGLGPTSYREGKFETAAASAPWHRFATKLRMRMRRGQLIFSVNLAAASLELEHVEEVLTNKCTCANQAQNQKTKKQKKTTLKNRKEFCTISHALPSSGFC
jgi:hypothetical protein